MKEIKLNVSMVDFSKAFENASASMRRLESSLRKIDNRSKFEKFYDSVSNFLFGGKSFFTKRSNTR